VGLKKATRWETKKQDFSSLVGLEREVEEEDGHKRQLDRTWSLVGLGWFCFDGVGLVFI
jgi:hypothetical protein